MVWCMRTTITLPDDLYRQAKETALASSRTFAQLIEDAVRMAMVLADQPSSGTDMLPTAPGAPRPGVDLDDSAALLDAMDGMS